VILLHSTTGAQAHIVLEAAAYAIGARVYWANARKTPRPDSLVDRWVLLACVLFGAALGSKLLHVIEHIGYFMHGASRYEFLGGKSILGGLVGGTLGAEAGKRWVGWHASTGDAWVPALAVGLIIGRIGCQFSGLWDGTFGSPYHDSYWAAPPEQTLARAQAAFDTCWNLTPQEMEEHR